MRRGENGQPPIWYHFRYPKPLPPGRSACSLRTPENKTKARNRATTRPAKIAYTALRQIVQQDSRGTSRPPHAGGGGGHPHVLLRQPRPDAALRADPQGVASERYLRRGAAARVRTEPRPWRDRAQAQHLLECQPHARSGSSQSAVLEDVCPSAGDLSVVLRI